LRLFYSPASPFVRKVMIVLHETGLIADTEIVPASGNAVVSGTMPVDQNPLGKVPTLVTEKGSAFYDSRVICRWLDEKAGSGFYPQDSRKWDCLTLEATADGMSEAGVLIVYEGRLRPENMRSVPWVEGQWEKNERALDALENRWIGYLDGPFDIAQTAVAAALGHFDFRHPARNWRAGRPRLTQWEAKIALRPSLRATQPHD
jgi:glutathione S-transferase